MMNQRGGDEPEYIDDDEYFDPDTLGSDQRGSSNVLGGGRSRRDSEANRASSDRKAARPASPRDGNPPQRAASAARPGKKPRPVKQQAVKPRERGDKRAAQKPAQVPHSKPSANKGADGGDKQDAAARRFSRLRPPFRSGKATVGAKQEPGPRNKHGKASKLKALSSRVGKLRHNLKRSKADADNRPPQPTSPSGDKTRKSSVRAAFGASPGETRRTGREKQTVGAAGLRSQRATADERGTSPSSQVRPNKAPIFKSSEWLDLDRKLDLIGVGLVFAAIVLFFSALSSEQAAIGLVHKLIGQVLGWGALAVPITMFAIGMWLIVRHFGEQAPMIDPVRLAGAITAFIGMLTLFHFGESLSYASDSYCAPDCVRGLVERSYLGGRGGGLIGGWIYQVLVINLTEVGGFVVVAMALTFATMMITRLSMAELAVIAVSLTRSLRDNMAQRAARRRAQQLILDEQALLAQQANVRVSKPEAAKLSGAVAGMNALPEPSGETMPIPIRLRDMLSKRVSLMRAAAEPKAGSAHEIPAMTEPERQGPRIFGRFIAGFDDSADSADSATSASEARSHAPAANPPPVPKPNIRPNWRAFGDKPAPLPKESRRPLPPSEPIAAQAEPFTGPSGPTPAAQNATPKEGPIQQPSKQPAKQSMKQSMKQSTKPPEEVPESQPRQEPRAADAFGAGSPRADDKARARPRRADSARALSPASGADEASESLGKPEVPSQRLDDAQQADGKDAAPEPASAETVSPAAKPLAADMQTVPTSSARRSRPRSDWRMPNFRATLTGGSSGEMDEEVLLEQSQIIEDTLASFGAPGRVVELNTGPVITQFGVEPDYQTSRAGKRSRVKVSAIAQLDKDLQLALGAKSIRIQAPVPGKGYVGIEVPNPDSAMVSLRDVMESRSFQEIDSPLAIALGMSVDGNPVSADLSQMPHLLIAGTTGSGKSKCINAIIISMLANRSPDEVKFIMVDPKRVELTGYNGLPHLVAPVVVELEKAVGVLRWVTREMDERYKKFSQVGARHLIDYNHILEADSPSMPYIVVIIDELADLMMSAADETERAISRIAALARATGIHLVIATQRPSVDVVTGLIKANFPARIAFAVAGSVDSRVILDQPGAERLLGKGDMLYLSGNAPVPQRMQGVFVSDEEIDSITRFWKLQNLGLAGIEAISLPAAAGGANSIQGNGHADGAAKRDALSQASFWDDPAQRDLMMAEKAGSADPQEDELYQTAVEMVRRQKKASISLLQRRLRIGYGRAARIMDVMEERGVVGPPKEGSSKPRDVLPF